MIIRIGNFAQIQLTQIILNIYAQQNCIKNVYTK